MTKDFITKIGMHYAWEGICHAFHEHINFKIHLAISSLTLFLAITLRVSVIKLTFLLFAITLGLVVEMLNTAIEAVVDLITTERRQSAKIAKDVAAGAMLITAIGSALIGAILLVPEILKILSI